MKIKIFNLLMIFGLVAALSACDDAWEPKTQKQGKLNLSSIGVDINDVAAARASSIDLSKFIVSVISGTETVKEWAYADMPEIITLPVGSYTLQVKSHEVEKAEFSHPYYLGTTTFTIKENEITSLGTVECKFASLKVTVLFSDKLKAKMGDDCKVVVKANDEGTLTYTRETEESGYFEALEGSSTLVALFSGTVDGNYRELQPVTYTDVAMGTHYTITFSLREGDGTIITDPTQNPAEGGSITETQGGIVINTTIESGNTQLIDAEINVGEEDIDVPIDPGERPGTEHIDDPTDPGTDPGTDPSTPGTPAEEVITFSSSTLSFTDYNPVNVPEALVKLYSKNGFQHLNVQITSDNEAFIGSVSELLPTTFDLATVTGETADNLDSIGLPVGPFAATITDLDFNITELVPLLEAFSGHHEFNLTIVDYEGNTKSLTLKFVAD